MKLLGDTFVERKIRSKSVHKQEGALIPSEQSYRELVPLPLTDSELKNFLNLASMDKLHAEVLFAIDQIVYWRQLSHRLRQQNRTQDFIETSSLCSSWKHRLTVLEMVIGAKRLNSRS